MQGDRVCHPRAIRDQEEDLDQEWGQEERRQWRIMDVHLWIVKGVEEDRHHKDILTRDEDRQLTKDMATRVMATMPRCRLQEMDMDHRAEV